MAYTGPHVSVHALDAGYLTLTESKFIAPVDDPTSQKTVPSLSFLIQHKDTDSTKTTRIVFDLGIRKKLEDYVPNIYENLKTRQPVGGTPDTVESLATGGLTPDDIDMVVFSHLHYDHIGTPSDYPKSTYVIGPGSASLIDGTRFLGPEMHNTFEIGMLDMKRTVELHEPDATDTSRYNDESKSPQTQALYGLFNRTWHKKGPFDAVLDMFGDGSVYVVSAPGHLDGHINLLCRKADGDFVYLAGDACHDLRMLTGEKHIATWTEPGCPGKTLCIHRDKALAEKTIAAMREASTNTTELGKVQIILAHDEIWTAEAKKNGQFFPGTI